MPPVDPVLEKARAPTEVLVISERYLVARLAALPAVAAALVARPANRFGVPPNTIRDLQKATGNKTKNLPGAYREWHNRFRPHAAHDTLTPIEVEAGSRVVEMVCSAQRGGVESVIQLERKHARDDRRLCHSVIHVHERRRETA